MYRNHFIFSHLNSVNTNNGPASTPVQCIITISNSSHLNSVNTNTGPASIPVRDTVTISNSNHLNSVKTNTGPASTSVQGTVTISNSNHLNSVNTNTGPASTPVQCIATISNSSHLNSVNTNNGPASTPVQYIVNTISIHPIHGKCTQKGTGRRVGHTTNKYFISICPTAGRDPIPSSSAACALCWQHTHRCCVNACGMELPTVPDAVRECLNALHLLGC